MRIIALKNTKKFSCLVPLSHAIPMKRFTIGLVGLGVIFFSACGRKTPPRPITLEAAFGQLAIIQRGNHMQLSWVMHQSLPSERGPRQFQIEESQLNPQCLQCPPEVVAVFTWPFPSKNFFFEGRQVRVLLPLRKDLNVHNYKITYQDALGNALNPPQGINFTSYVEFPPLPTLQWKFLPEGTRPQLQSLPAKIPSETENIRLLRLSWERQQETVEFYFSNQGGMTQRDRFYRVNIYKTALGEPWPQNPINAQPVAATFYIDSQLKTEHAFDYQIRWVDSRGNESPPSITYTIAPKL